MINFENIILKRHSQKYNLKMLINFFLIYSYLKVLEILQIYSNIDKICNIMLFYVIFRFILDDSEKRTIKKIHIFTNEQ